MRRVKKAFSLIELLIVIMIIGITYTLAIGSFEKIAEEKIPLTLKNLKNYLHTFEREKSVEFLCLDRCRSCDIYVDGEIQSELEGSFDEFLDDSLKVYRYEYGLGAVQKEMIIYFNSEDVEEKVCFSYTLNKQGIGEQYLVEYQEEVYDFSTYFEPTAKYNSLDEAVDAKDAQIEEVFR